MVLVLKTNGDCGDDRDRTDYLFNAIEALYQLSYIPQNSAKSLKNRHLYGKWSKTENGAYHRGYLKVN